MRPLFLNATAGLRRLVTFIGVCAFVVVLTRTDYDARTGLRFRDYPFPWQISQLTKQQALSMIVHHLFCKSKLAHWAAATAGGSYGK